ncbi:unnamed protein product [Bursaphelenchus xylophilus]|uniref:(pine wood nematode) hypothetical protein n=1 Tax=Bursaphelenchus xylophilus TaxID=6326 RepID=A0A7I8X8K2_BURXY|nr:unnamed protein product [Bursaphelenchus xylophilus]CAG9126021.1 unnamed protein product [Bursaphelenchus xylophilus]
MFTLTSLCCLLALAAAAPAEKEVEAADTLTYGVDFVDEIDSRHVTCFRNLNYNLVLVRIYNGGVDEVGFRNLDTVYKTLTVQLVVVPELNGAKTATYQVNEILDAAKAKGWDIKGIWLQITSPLSWDKSTARNVYFIQEFVREANAKGVKINYYTNWYDYKVITGNSRLIATGSLWYWNVLGSGEGAQTPSNFNDFRAFGPFRSALFKQYGQDKYVCGTYVNQDVYVTSSLQGKPENGVEFVGKKE